MISRHRYFWLLTLCIYCLEDATAQKGSEETERQIDEIFVGLIPKRPKESVTTPSAVIKKGPTETSILPEDCECVAYYLCNGTHINTNGEGVIDIRSNDNPCGSYLDICCSVAQTVTEKITPAPPINDQTGCGWRYPDGVGVRIEGEINGEAKFGEFPWMVAILQQEMVNGEVNGVYKCGGALIHPQAVITAAHCVVNRELTFRVRAGEWDTQTTEEILLHQTRQVKSITIHPEYYGGALYNDVALLVLESPFTLDLHIDVACLPPQGTVISSGERCWANGWGKDQFGAAGKYMVIMKKIDLPIVDRDTCQNNLRSTRLGKYFKLHESFVCAGGEPGKDTCKGDGGSPLVCPIPGQPDRYQHVGIVSWGIGCGENNIPGVYGNVAGFRNWIDAQMANNNFETSQYQY